MMDTLVIDRGDRALLVTPARRITAADQLGGDTAARWDPDRTNPHVKWIAGNYAESDRPNSNTQYWTGAELAAAEPTIRYSPLNMVHKTRQPVGFLHSTAALPADDHDVEGAIRIEVLAGLWEHVFPFESALVDAAAERDALFLSMECVGTHLHCTGPDGCEQSFIYGQTDDYCTHLQERSSYRHIVNPAFRGCALIVPPVRPGWSGATAEVLAAVTDEATKLAARAAATPGSPELDAVTWEYLMAQVLTVAG